MKQLAMRIATIGICLLVFATFGSAESIYVTDVLKLTLRSGPSTEHKILSVIESGQQLEILDRGPEWTLVRLPNDKEGYVLTRYLSTTPTAGIRLQQLQEKHKSLMQQTASLLEENAQFKSENNQLSSSLGSNEKTLEQVRAEYEKLKADSAQFLTLKSKYDKAAAQLEEQTKRADSLEEQLNRFEMNQYIKWFLAGSGVLLVGFIIGFSARRQRRRPSLL
ncbi:MAG: TIGR04211 family SH3 domain-containing protein [Desulfobacterales bacterium]|jgi:SH3 domain protein